ncbi:MAG: protein-L-isoaspartate(D-aspartate) O-methyltransferase [Planctomycetes bacterium]|nr:protein-L-isoaspartate(D-aspartate) O-methyltransferase [Planctomycetota bacterium]
MDNQEERDRFEKARSGMLKHDLKGRGITDANVLVVMGGIPREEFVQDSYKSQAYFDGALPIGLGQTISQPYIVGLMTQELHLAKEHEVLEIGTGSGYQTAILSKLVKKVYTIDRHHELTESAQAVLGRLGITNVEYYIGDGSCGWPEEKVFDRIMVTAAVPEIPEGLLDQLVDGGLIIAPVGGGSSQKLIACQKKMVGYVERAFCDVRFVKLIGRDGFKE